MQLEHFELLILCLIYYSLITYVLNIVIYLFMYTLTLA